MEPTADEIAGVADLFGGLTREELRRAFTDLAAREGTAFDPDALDAAIDDAVAGYYLVAVERDGRELLAPGPTALPTLPPHGEDLPHMLSVEEREVGREALARAAEERLRAEAARAVADGDEERADDLLDVCYEIDAWAGIDTAELRDRLSAPGE